MKLIRHAALLAMALALAMGSVTADKLTCGDASDVTPTLTPAPTTEAPTPTPTTEAPTPTPTTEAPTPAPTPAPTLPEKRIEYQNSATNKTFVVALPVAEGVCFTYYPCIEGFATAMTWNAPLWTSFNSGRSVVYFFPEDRCTGAVLRWMGMNTPFPITGVHMRQSKSVLFRTDPSVASAVFDPSFITSHASC